MTAVRCAKSWLYTNGEERRPRLNLPKWDGSPHIDFLKEPDSPLRLGIAVAVFEQVDQNLCHTSLRFAIVAVGVKQFTCNIFGRFSVAIELLKPSDKAIRVLSEPHGKHCDATAHREADFLVRPVTLMKLRVQQRDKCIASG